MKPKISIVMPAYKVEEFIERCLNSIVNQTYKNLEIILIDDGSPDKCPQICDDYAKKDNRIKVIHKQNGGLMAAWIDGLKLAAGDYVYFVDSDDWLELDSVQNYIDVIDKHHPDMIINDYYLTSEKFKKHKKGVQYEKYGFLEGDDFSNFKEAYFNHSCAFTYYRWNKVVKKDILLQNIKYCDTRVSIFEDVNIIFAVMFDIKNIYLLEKPSYNYYVRENSMIRAVFREKDIVNHERVLDKILKIQEEKNIETEHLICYLIYFMNMCLVDGILNNKNKKQYFKLLEKSSLLNNDYTNKVPQYLGFLKGLIYKNLIKKKYFKVAILRKLALLKKKLSGN